MFKVYPWTKPVVLIIFWVIKSWTKHVVLLIFWLNTKFTQLNKFKYSAQSVVLKQVHPVLT